MNTEEKQIFDMLGNKLNGKKIYKGILQTRWNGELNYIVLSNLNKAIFLGLNSKVRDYRDRRDNVRILNLAKKDLDDQLSKHNLTSELLSTEASSFWFVLLNHYSDADPVILKMAFDEINLTTVFDKIIVMDKQKLFFLKNSTLRLYSTPDGDISKREFRDTNISAIQR